MTNRFLIPMVWAFVKYYAIQYAANLMGVVTVLEKRCSEVLVARKMVEKSTKRWTAENAQTKKHRPESEAAEKDMGICSMTKRQRLFLVKIGILWLSYVWVSITLPVS